MIVDITIPSPGESISTVSISAWLKADGQQVAKNDDLLEVESEKATLAVSALIRAASDDPRLRRLTAETAVGNAASQIVLSRNGFQQTGHRLDPDDGELILWSLDL